MKISGRRLLKHHDPTNGWNRRIKGYWKAYVNRISRHRLNRVLT